MIDYQNISDSIVFYSKYGYERIETPWTVSKKIAMITKPNGLEEVPDFEIGYNKKLLVASGEQSFLYLYLKGFLPKGKFQTITPCFRYESFDEFHTKYFLKNELINTKEVDFDSLMSMVHEAFEFFSERLGKKDLKIIKKGNRTMDIEYKGIELGSYGIRSCKFLEWIYGTGCAEPRLSSCQSYKL